MAHLAGICAGRGFILANSPLQAPHRYRLGLRIFQLALEPVDFCQSVLQRRAEEPPLSRMKWDPAKFLRALYLQTRNLSDQLCPYIDISLWRRGNLFLQVRKILGQPGQSGHAPCDLDARILSSGIVRPANFGKLVKADLALAYVFEPR